VRIFGEETQAGERVAAELGRALQLTNILRDLAKDAKRHRLYLPREVLQTHGIHATSPSSVLAQPTLPDVCRDVAMLAEKHYAAGAKAIAMCPRRAMRPAAAMLHNLSRSPARTTRGRLEENRFASGPGRNWFSCLATGWWAVKGCRPLVSRQPMETGMR